MSKIMFEKSTTDKYRYPQITTMFALNNCTSPLFFSVLCALCGSFLLDQNQATAQITPTPNDANTVVNQTDNTFNIQGGTQTGSNLFHSFEKFGLNQGQIANFISNPSIQNILGRVTGGEASVINGLIQVTGGNSNLFLMNPAGMIFGPNASLNVPAAFTATTANGIGFNNQWFNAVGTNNYASLVGNPDAFAFTQPSGAIINNANLTGSSGQSLTLLGGTVINTGIVQASGGTINITAVSGEKLVRITPQGSLLSLGLPVDTKAAINPMPFTPQSLPALLTGGGLKLATTVIVAPDGQVTLRNSDTSPQPGEESINPSELTVDANGVLKRVSSPTAVGNGNVAIEPLSITVDNGVVTSFDSNIQIQNGDVVVSSLYGKNATISADNNFIFEGGSAFDELTTTDNLNLLAQNKVQLRDFLNDPNDTRKRVVQVGGDLKIQGNQGIDIQFNTRPDSIIETGGDLSLISDGTIVGNASFATGENFSILNLSGGAGNLTFGTSNGTPSQPIISSNGDVNLGNYTSSSLKVETRGSILAENITINDKNIALQGTDPDISVLASSPSLILRAGLNQLRNTPSNPSETVSTSPGSITINGDINISPPDSNSIFGPVILSAKDNINVQGNISGQSSSFGGRGSPVILNSSQGSITVGDIQAGNTMLLSAGNITARDIIGASNGSENQNSDMGFLFSRTGNIVLDTIRIRSGSIDISTAGVFQAKETLPVSFAFSGPSDVPASVLAGRRINIQQGKANLEQGLGVKKDQSGNPIYRVEPDGKQVFFRGNSFTSGSDVVFRDKNGNLVVVPSGNSDNQAVFVDENEQFVSDRPITIESVDNFDPSSVASNISYTRGLIILQQGSNAQLTGIYQDTQLGSSNGISVVTVSPGGGGAGGGGGASGGGGEGGGGVRGGGDNGGGVRGGGDNGNSGVDRPIAAQNQLINQPSQKDVCQPTNTSLPLEQRPQQGRAIPSDTAKSSNANACQDATQGNNILRINQDNRTVPIPNN